MFEEKDSSPAKQAEKMRRDSTLFEIGYEKAIEDFLCWFSIYVTLRHHRNGFLRRRDSSGVWIQGHMNHAHSMMEAKLESAYAMARAMDGCKMAARIYEEEIDEYSMAVTEGGPHGDRY